MSKKRKTLKEQRMIRSQQNEQVLADALKFSKTRFKRFDEVILLLHMNEDLSKFFIDKRIEKIQECFVKLSSNNKQFERCVLKGVLVHLSKCSLLVSGEEHIQAIFNMVLFKRFWIRDAESWKPTTKSSDAQLKELADHLFCRYSVPKFMYRVFYEKEKTFFINWFIHIGIGKKIRDLMGMPITFTRKMGHHFLQAPDKFSIHEALRWAQVKGLNGDDKLAERIAYSWIGTKAYSNEAFWESFIILLVNGGMFNHDKITELIDYVRTAKRDNGNYSLKGRTLSSVMRQSDEWHEKAVLVRGSQFWDSCGIPPYKSESKSEIIVMEELTGSKLLADEGRAMKHCVGTYVHCCVKGRTAIFSMRKYIPGMLIDTLATVEVNLALRRIVQAKAKMNRSISAEAKKHIGLWAETNALTISPYL